MKFKWTNHVCDWKAWHEVNFLNKWDNGEIIIQIKKIKK
jgi:hypothetical protein